MGPVIHVHFIKILIICHPFVPFKWNYSIENVFAKLQDGRKIFFVLKQTWKHLFRGIRGRKTDDSWRLKSRIKCLVLFSKDFPFRGNLRVSAENPLSDRMSSKFLDVEFLRLTGSYEQNIVFHNPQPNHSPFFLHLWVNVEKATI